MGALKRGSWNSLTNKGGVEDEGEVGVSVNPLKNEYFVTEIQCKRNIHFHLILVGILSISILSVKNREVKQRFLAIRQILLRKMRVIC